MLQIDTFATGLRQSITAAFIASAFAVFCQGNAGAGDREDAKALVGSWTYQGILGNNYEFKADGTYYINGLGGFGTSWTVKNGKLVLKPLLGSGFVHDFTLTPDEKTLKFNGGTYKRK